MTQLTQWAAPSIGASWGLKPGPGSSLCRFSLRMLWVVWVIAGSLTQLTQLTQWPTSWRPAAARPVAGSSSAEGPSAMQKSIGRRPKGHGKGPGQQLGG
jgi:hypothetical protein